jgi:hypothetical protein
MRDYRANKNQIAVSANNQETAINTEQTLDTSLLVDLNNVISLEPRREHNGDELTGKEEPDTVYNLGNLSNWSISFAKAQPQHCAFLISYALGAIATSVLGDGYKHVITPIDGDEDGDRSLPTFTAAQRYGETILKRRFASMAVDSFSLKASRDNWLSISGTVKGTGKNDDNIVEEDITAAENVTELTLAANAVEGGDAATRLQNVQRIRIYDLEDNGAYTEVDYSAVSDATPAVISISAPGTEVDERTYKVLYIPDESGDAWMSFPARVTETPLRVSQCTFKLGGAWNGTEFVGGRELDAELNSIEWSFANNLDVQFNFGADGAYASRIFRNNRLQTVKLNREMRDYIFQQHIDDNDYDIGVYLLAEGALYDATYKYQIEIIFPKCAVLTAPISVDGKKVGEAGDLQVLEDDTYGSVIVIIQNLQATYAA